MAGAHRTAIEPERRFAQNFSLKYKLAPPVKIEPIVREFADLEEVVIPGSADAIVLRRPGRRTKVLLSVQRNASRRRFTLAHELGHIILPWQVGSAFCHPHVTYIAPTDVHGRVEAQANRFATELLVPEQWLAANLNTGGPHLARQILALADAAGVSPIVVSIALAPVYERPSATVVSDGAGSFKYPVFSKTFPLRRYSKWWLDQETVKKLGGTISTATFGSYGLTAVCFEEPTTPEVGTSMEDSRTILTEILAAVPSEMRAKLRHRISGIIGYAYNSAIKSKTSGAILRILQQRFFGTPDLQLVTHHPRFGEFLAAKANELHARRSR